MFYITDSDQLTWVKWRAGMILQYGNLNILTIEELGSSIFPISSERKGIKVFAEEQWQEHNGLSVFGIDIRTPDVYPILKFPEAKKKYRRVNSRQRNGPQSEVDNTVHKPERESRDGHMTNRMVSIDQIDSEFEKLRIRLDISRSSGGSMQGAWSGTDMVWEGPKGGRMSPGLARRKGSNPGGLRQGKSYDR